MLDSKPAQDNPILLLFLPLIYTVWSDSILTPTEIQIIQGIITRQQWIKPHERDFLLGFLDPQRPPGPDQLKRWLDAIRDAGPDPGKHESLVDIGVRLVEQHTKGTTNGQLRTAAASLAGIEESIGVIGREAAFNFLTVGRNTFTETQSTSYTFDVSVLQSILDGENRAIIEKVKTIISDQAFNLIETGDLATYREHVLEWCRHLATQGFGSIAYPQEYGGQGDMRSYFAIMETLSYHDLSLVVKFGVQFGLFGMSVYFLGTEKHHRQYLRQIGTLELPGCFAMTETNHGSNVKGIETTATYDHATRAFVIHTPHGDARKEFIGNAACHGRMATVFAKLIIEGKDYGVSAFLVPIRSQAGKPMPGISIADCGRKMGLNGVDNGLIHFDNVRVPYDNMLDRFASIDKDGKFQSPITSDNRRFFTMLGTLVGGRIGIPRSGLSASKAGLTIAIRYGDKRRQFGPEGGTEVPVLNYRTHQRRLMPPLARVYALHFALQYLTRRFLQRTDEDIQEIEALAAGLKAYATWNTTATLQECRECCGGKGYMTENRIDDLKNDTDVFTTFEGDNTVLMQLVAKSRLTEFKQEFGNMNLFGMLTYVANQAKTSIAEKNPFTVRNTDDEHLLDNDFHLNAFAYRERTVLTSAARRLKRYLDDGIDSFEAFNKCQHHLVQVSFAYIERIILEQFIDQVDRTEDSGCRAVLQKLCNLFALSVIEENKGWYLENDYMEGVKSKAVRRMVDRLCSEIREEAVPLVDAFSIPNSLLGKIG